MDTGRTTGAVPACRCFSQRDSEGRHVRFGSAGGDGKHRTGSTPEVEVFLEAPVVSSVDTDFLVTSPSFTSTRSASIRCLPQTKNYRCPGRSGKANFNARQTMIERNLRLVVNIAKHYSTEASRSSIWSREGSLRLIHALEKFGIPNRASASPPTPPGGSARTSSGRS